MQSVAKTPKEYVDSLAEYRKTIINNFRKAISKTLPKGFSEVMNYGMIGYVVPHSLYQSGYHCDPKLPLPFMGLASQKNFIALYHMGIYSDPSLLKWFQEAHAKASTKKLDMGKSCIRYKKPDDIPFELVAELVSKMTPDDWITRYEKMLKR